MLLGRFLGQRDAEMEEQEGRVNGFGPGPDRRASDWGPIALLDKTKEFFRTCDVEGKGFITRKDMRVSKKRAICGSWVGRWREFPNTWTMV